MEDAKHQPPIGDDEDLNDEPARRTPGPSEEQHRQPEPLQAPGEEHKEKEEDEDEPSEPQKIIA